MLYEEKIMIEDWALITATFLLVCVTAYYAIQTGKTVKEMKKAREAEFLPHLKLSIVFLGPVNILIKIVNVGRGPAMNVKVKHWLEGLKNAERSWNVPLLMPSQYEEFRIPTGKDSYETSAKFFKKERRKLGMEAVCTDILGNQKEFKDVVDVKEMIDSLISAGANYKEDELHRIRRELEGIKKELGSR
jgi:hypothetical protein